MIRGAQIDISYTHRIPAGGGDDGNVCDDDARAGNERALVSPIDALLKKVTLHISRIWWRTAKAGGKKEEEEERVASVSFCSFLLLLRPRWRRDHRKGG